MIITPPVKPQRQVEPQEDGSANIVEGGMVVAQFSTIKDARRYLKHLDVSPSE